MIGGWIEFLPAEGTVGNLRSAPIGADGSFQADGVAIGTNFIGLTDAKVSIPGGWRRFQTTSKPPEGVHIERKIPPSSSSPLVIDLLEELFRQQAAGE